MCDDSSFWWKRQGDWTRNVQKLTLCIPDSGIHYKTLNWGQFVLILLKFPVKCFEALWLWGILSEIQSARQSDSFAIKSLPKPLKCGEFDNMLQIGSFTPHSQLIFLSTTLSFYHFINPENLEYYPLWSLYVHPKVQRGLWFFFNSSQNLVCAAGNVTIATITKNISNAAAYSDLAHRSSSKEAQHMEAHTEAHSL